MPQSYFRHSESLLRGRTYYYDGYGQQVGTVEYTGSEYRAIEEGRQFKQLTSIPDYKSFRKENGYLPTTRIADTIREARGVFVVQSQTNQDGNILSEEGVSMIVGYPVGEAFPVEHMDAAWYRLTSKAGNNDFNLGVTVAEGQKTVDYVAGIATKYAKAFGAFKAGKITKAARTLGIDPYEWERSATRVIAGSWLSFKFGWVPMLMDARSAAELVARQEINRQKKAYKIEARFDERKSEDQILSDNPTWQRQRRATVNTAWTAKAWARLRVENSTLRAAAEAGITNPLAVAWELTPFSFVADYFMNIGNYIQSLHAFDGLTLLDVGYSMATEVSGMMYQGLGPGRHGERCNSFKTRDYVRIPEVWSPSPLGALKPSLGGIDLSRLTTICALIRQLHSS